MKPLYTEENFNKAKSNDKLLCECYVCNLPFLTTKKFIQETFNPNLKRRIKYCSRKCQGIDQNFRQTINCLNCKELFTKKLADFKKSKNHFCSKSCAVTYNNTHKTTGYRRSKLEVYLEHQLIKLYPNLEFHFNRKDAINSELDIYIPYFKLAFELNGIFHYEPIFGNEQLTKIQNNDKRKYQACLEHNIELCIIDAASLKYFKEQNCIKYLNIIINIINLKAHRA